MKKFNICVNVVFEGTVTVKANNKEEAKQVVRDNFRATIGDCGCNMNENIQTWEVDVHGETCIA